MSKLLELKNIKKTYIMGTAKIHALDGIDLEIDEGDFVAIMGQSGSGKSTLLHILGLLDNPSSGSYKILNQETSYLNEDGASTIRRQVIGFIFQQFNLLPRTSALQNVALPLMYSKGDYTLELAEKLLEEVGLESRMGHFSNELSGGQQQRVAIARSLVNNPYVILADEPTGNLDSKSEKEIMALLKKLHSQGMTVIVVTHEEEIGREALRMIRMRDGKILSDTRQGPLQDPKRFVNDSSSKILNKTFTLKETQKEDVQIDEEMSSEKNLEKKREMQEERMQKNKKSSFDFFIFLKYLIRHFSSCMKILMANKVRTLLSTLGILIGVAAVVSILALGEGMKQQVEEQMASMGSNLLSVRGGIARSSTGVRDQSQGTRIRLLPDDALALKREIAHVDYAVPKVDGRVQLVYLNKNWSTSALGTTPDYQYIRDYTTQIGRYFTEEENIRRARVAIVGVVIVKEVFGGENPIGKLLRINREAYTVIGVLTEKGGSGFTDQDDIVIIPLNTAMYRLMGQTHLDNIDIKVSDRVYLDEVETNVLHVLNRRHKIPKDMQENSFWMMNMAALQESANETTSFISLFLTMVAAISLLVGGIGIMNIMLVSVTERTREIGLRKAVGAKRFDIMIQFLIESVLIGFSGGLLGVMASFVLTFVIEYLLEWTMSISPFSILLAFGFSIIIGVVFGLYPARRASRLAAIEALRYE